MTISPVSVGAAVTPTVIKTYISHYTNRSARHQKPTAHISYDEGLHLIQSFLGYASHHTVEDLQAFTAQWVPTPNWVRIENVLIPQEYIRQAADKLIAQLGPSGVQEVGGSQWWQWRRKNTDLKAEWIEMRADFNARKQLDVSCKRIMFYVHGGAYFFGSVDEHRYQMQRHARKLKARVFAPRYRLAPQFPFPCGLQDCLAAYLYLLTLHDKTEIIMAGDSAGGGMIVSIMCLLRDQGLPLPAGAILISPWVDLTHSFPSVAADNSFDYIPAHGFMHKPSISWPPPNDNEMDAIRAGAGKDLLKGRNKLEKREIEREAAQGFAVKDVSNENEATHADTTTNDSNKLYVPSTDRPRSRSTAPGPRQHLQIEVDGKLVELRDQIQLYTTNQLISHPLVSPILQPSLGGLPPLLITTGGGEVLRDEQIYLAHKAAHPAKYPLGDEYRARYDPDGTIIDKYKPTPVQLQVWEDLCHVAPTLSFTRPAKFMYRSVAQFGAWALARAQDTDIEIVDDDEISIISSDSDASRRRHERNKSNPEITRAVGKAGDPIPAFKHHMIRQRVDRHGNIHPLEDASEMPALQMPASEIGVIKIAPVKIWMDAKLEWDTKYARIKRKVQKRRIAELVKGDVHIFEGEEPPPSALAGRRKHEDMMLRKQKKSYWLAIWSGWGSKHDEDTIKREEEAGVSETRDDPQVLVNGEAVDGDTKRRSLSRSRRKSVSRDNRSQSRKRMTIVSDAGQVESDTKEASLDGVLPTNNETQPRSEDQDMPVAYRTDSATDTHLTPMFMPKFKTATHLRSDSREMSDVSSIRTGYSIVSPDNASTRAVFSAAGVSKEHSAPVGGSLLGADLFHDNVTQNLPGTADGADDKGTGIKIDDLRSNLGGYDTPVSKRSVERLISHQVDIDGVSLAGTDNSTLPIGLAPAPKGGPLRSPSSMAIVQHEGVVDIVEGGVADPHVNEEDEPTPTQEKTTHTPALITTEVLDSGEVKQERPKMYERNESKFQTAMEYL